MRLHTFMLTVEKFLSGVCSNGNGGRFSQRSSSLPPLSVLSSRVRSTKAADYFRKETLRCGRDRVLLDILRRAGKNSRKYASTAAEFPHRCRLGGFAKSG